jgi:hypothetical protein
MDWFDFVATEFNRSTYQGHVTPESWQKECQGNDDDDYTPYVACDYFIPSRFALSYDTNLDVAFIALDQERLGLFTDNCTHTDLGDDILQFKKGNPKFNTATADTLVHPNLADFLDSDLTKVAADHQQHSWQAKKIVNIAFSRFYTKQGVFCSKFGFRNSVQNGTNPIFSCLKELCLHNKLLLTTA